MPPQNERGYPLDRSCEELFDSVAVDDLNRFEEGLNYALPGHFRDFLLQHNGVRFTDPKILNCLEVNSEEIGTALVVVLYGLPHHPGLYDLREIGKYNDFSLRVPNNYLAIGEGRSHHKLCICLDGPHQGPIFYWCPDLPWEENVADNTPTEDQLLFIASDFRQFWKMLSQH